MDQIELYRDLFTIATWRNTVKHVTSMKHCMDETHKSGITRRILARVTKRYKISWAKSVVRVERSVSGFRYFSLDVPLYEVSHCLNLFLGLRRESLVYVGT